MQSGRGEFSTWNEGVREWGAGGGRLLSSWDGGCQSDPHLFELCGHTAPIFRPGSGIYD